MGVSISVLFLLAASVTAGPASSATPSSGVYLTAEDYAHGALTDGGGCEASFKVALHDVTNKPFIDIARGSRKKRYAKTEVFGVRLCDGHDYRLVSSHLYRILEAKALFIYATEHPVSQGKGFRVVPAYYFSSGARGELLPLTLDNLHRVYASNQRFIDSLDRVWEREIAEYDAYHQQFKVGRLLAESTPDH
jgi:hypothetical protein